MFAVDDIIRRVGIVKGRLLLTTRATVVASRHRARHSGGLDGEIQRLGLPGRKRQHARRAVGRHLALPIPAVGEP